MRVACLLPLAGGPDVGIKVTPTKTQWEDAYRLVSSFKLNGIRGDKDILDGTQIGWGVLWGDIKSSGFASPSIANGHYPKKGDLCPPWRCDFQINQ